jgi:hypothetical protein
VLLRPQFGTHLSEDTLEEYAFGRIEDPQLGEIEEHLLICETCQEALARVDAYIRLMKVAAAQPIVTRPRRRFAAYIVAGLIAAGLALTLVFALPGKSGPPEVVDLVSMRGAEMARMHAGRAADLRISAIGIADGVYRVDVVDWVGRVMWTGPAQSAGERMLVAEPKALRAGLYWVRLYSVQGELLREFGIDSVR